MPFSPVRFYLNDQLMYRSGAEDEMKPDAKIVVPLVLKPGWNTLLIEACRTEAGFGCRFGAQEGKVRILQVLSPFADRKEAAGWAYAGPLTAGMFGESGIFRMPTELKARPVLAGSRSQAGARKKRRSRILSVCLACRSSRYRVMPGADCMCRQALTVLCLEAALWGGRKYGSTGNPC